MRAVQRLWIMVAGPYRSGSTDPAVCRYVAHLIAAVQEEAPEFGSDHLHDVLRREVGADQRDIVRIISAVSELNRPLILVIDDYHEIDNPAVHNLQGG